MLLSTPYMMLQTIGLLCTLQWQVDCNTCQHAAMLQLCCMHKHRLSNTLEQSKLPKPSCKLLYYHSHNAMSVNLVLWWQRRVERGHGGGWPKDQTGAPHPS